MNMSDHPLPGELDRRRAFSCERMEMLRARLAGLREMESFPNLSIYATGSYARNEASGFSDIDLFFLHKGSRATERTSRLDELRLFARVIEAVEDMHFPTFSNDGEYIKLLFLGDMLEVLGGREDDFHNYFTARMLLLLESTPLVNDSLYSEVLETIVGAYFRDYPDHPSNFRPVFLINDILRFWKTLCLNYEHRRNRPSDDQEKRRKQHVKNFKLKFSRMITCFGTIAAICALPPPIGTQHIMALTRKMPLERLVDAIEPHPDLSATRKAIVEDYVWFMEQTALSTEDLQKRFVAVEEKGEMFRRADAFGARVYDALHFVAERNAYKRHLVI